MRTGLEGAVPQVKVSSGRAGGYLYYFGTLRHNPSDLATRSSYQQLSIEVLQQYKFAEHCMGICFEPWFEENEPYGGSCTMFAKVRY